MLIFVNLVVHCQFHSKTYMHTRIYNKNILFINKKYRIYTHMVTILKWFKIFWRKLDEHVNIYNVS
jgi:hypothetical protein